MKRSRLITCRRILVVALLVFSTQAVWAQEEEGPRFQFKKVKGINIPVLDRAIFLRRFGENPLVPRTNDEVLRFARRLYVERAREAISEECGENVLGALFTALSNPDISDATRDSVDNMIDASTPSLPSTYTEGHFQFFYTTSDADANNNVTLNEIKETAKVLNDAWTDYATNFKEPKYYLSGGGCSGTKKMVDVKVYYLGTTLYGSTSSTQNYIELNSKFVVKDTCNRRTTPVHELFHRVEYSYGYVTGTPDMKWATEGTASWSQKHRASIVGDWLARMNQGLNQPDLALITGRAYDACHFWVYLGEQGQGEAPTVKLVWSTYETNGKDMKSAVETAVKNRVPNGSSFDQFAGWWSAANFIKDFGNAPPTFDYVEDEWRRTCGSTTFGPLVQVPRTTTMLTAGANFSTNGSVSAYGSDYFVFTIGASVTSLEVKLAGSSNNFGYAIVEIKNNQELGRVRSPAGGIKDYTYSKTVTAGQFSEVALIVIGNPAGGTYTVTAKAN
jgi:hypothetical protein